jgi:hypothetical protein
VLQPTASAALLSCRNSSRIPIVRLSLSAHVVPQLFLVSFVRLSYNSMAWFPLLQRPFFLAAIHFSTQLCELCSKYVFLISNSLHFVVLDAPIFTLFSHSFHHENIHTPSNTGRAGSQRRRPRPTRPCGPRRNHHRLRRRAVRQHPRQRPQRPQSRAARHDHSAVLRHRQ